MVNRYFLGLLTVSIILLVGCVQTTGSDNADFNPKDVFLAQFVIPSSWTDETKILMHKDKLSKGSIVEDAALGEFILEEDAWFVWADPDFESGLYAHESFGVFLFDDGQMDVKQFDNWPIVNGVDMLEDLSISEELDPKSPPVAVDVPTKESITLGNIRWKSTPSAVIIPPTPTYLDIPKAEQCPERYYEVPAEHNDPMHGKTVSIMGPSDKRISFFTEAKRFEEANINGNFDKDGFLRTPRDISEKLQDFTRLPPTSAIAIYISTHGIQLWDIHLRHVLTGDEITGTDIGLSNPSSNIDTSKLDEYKSQCFLGKTEILDTDFCNDLRSITKGIPDGYYVVDKKRKGWAIVLTEGGKKVRAEFDVNKLLGPLPSCEKYLASNACYSGSFVKENKVTGLSAYGGSTENQVGYTLLHALKNETARELDETDSGAKLVKEGKLEFEGETLYSGDENRVESLFGTVFTGRLLKDPPLDAKKIPDSSKPEFDAAFTAAKKITEKIVLDKGYEITVEYVNGLGVRTTDAIKIRHDRIKPQSPMMSYNPAPSSCYEFRRCAKEVEDGFIPEIIDPEDLDDLEPITFDPDETGDTFDASDGSIDSCKEEMEALLVDHYPDQIKVSDGSFELNYDGNGVFTIFRTNCPTKSAESMMQAAEFALGEMRAQIANGFNVPSLFHENYLTKRDSLTEKAEQKCPALEVDVEGEPSVVWGDPRECTISYRFRLGGVV